MRDGFAETDKFLPTLEGYVGLMGVLNNVFSLEELLKRYFVQVKSFTIR